MNHDDLKRLIESNLSSLSVDEALEKVAILIDLSGDLESAEGTSRALELCDQLETRQLPDESAALLSYFRANAWANRRRERPIAESWNWEQTADQNEILHLRRALLHDGFLGLGPTRKCQINTNLGNRLNALGRFVEAQEYWSAALSINPTFAMALANRGEGLTYYARSLYDGGHTDVLLRAAFHDITLALSEHGQWESLWNREAHEGCKRNLEFIQAALSPEFLAAQKDFDEFPIGNGVEEGYRRWCLNNRLFINPLNDITTQTIASSDVMTLPSLTVANQSGRMPVSIGFFNQLKQEFVSSRWLFYESSRPRDAAHFSDRGVLLYNTLDYPSYSLSVEQMKLAFRSLYSLFDKIAFFINEYLQLGIHERHVNFRRIWLSDQRKGNHVRTQFENSRNWPWRGLYWVAKDFFAEEMKDSMAPDARELSIIRNHLEHKYLKVHEMSQPDMIKRMSEADFAFSILRRDFEKKTLRLLKLARASLIYLSLGVHAEEMSRRDHIDKRQGVIGSLPLTPWNDDFKR